MVVALTGSSGLAGLSVGLVGLSRFLVAYPMGWITDRHGRKAGILLGLSLALVGSLILGVSMLAHSAVIFVIGMLAFGMGMNGAESNACRGDRHVPATNARAGAGLCGDGADGGPRHQSGNHRISRGARACPVGRRAGAAMVLHAGADPCGHVAGQICATRSEGDRDNLAAYWPDYKPPPARRAEDGDHARFSALGMLADPSMRMAVLSNCAATGNMWIVMVLTSLVLAHNGHSLVAIALSHMFHSAGMFAFTIPIGRLADRFGRSRVMFPGVFISLIGAALLAFTSHILTVTLGTFLVGLGWAAANVSATAFIADHAPTQVRGRAIGVADSFAGGVSVCAAFVTGPLIEWYGLPATGLTAVLLAAIPFLLRAVSGPMR